MGKKGHDKRTTDPLAQKPGALDAQLGADALAAPRGGKERRRKRSEAAARGRDDDGADDDAHAQHLTGGALGERILKVARMQQEELEEEERAAAVSGGAAGAAAASGGGLPLSLALGAADAPGLSGDDSDADYDDDIGGDFLVDRDMGDYLGDMELDEADERALEAFMNPSGSVAPRSLADIIAEKMREQGLMGAGEDGMASDESGERFVRGMDPKVMEVYNGVGKHLSHYRSGKLPKAFKIVPSLDNWEEVLYLTNPDKWAAGACFQATRLFSSNMNAKMAQRFYSLVLLPRVRSDIADQKRLHFALYQSLCKATYKPAAWFKGLLLPLCASGTCSLREAVIFVSVLTKKSLPAVHSAVALLKIAQMPYSGTNSFFIRAIIDKKYALPYKVIDALVDHFASFTDDPRALPVVWHQSLLCFIQRYKDELRPEDKVRIKQLVKKQFHYLITPEVHRELDHAMQRGHKAAAAAGAGKPIEAIREDVRDMPPVIMDE